MSIRKNLVVGIIIGLLLGITAGYGLNIFFDNFPENEIEDLRQQLSTLQNAYDTLDTTYVYLQHNYTLLQEDYNDLLFDYNLLNQPASDFVTINDLIITIAVHRTIYHYKDSVSGNVTVTYLNGTAFSGQYSLYVRSPTEGMSTGISSLIHGFAEFYLPSPVFRYGPGNYTVGVNSLSTFDGYSITGSSWANLPYVTVEAK